MKARLKDLTVGLDGRQQLVLVLQEDFRPLYDKYRDRDLAVEIKPYRPRRSLDANAYAWVLIGKISEALTAEAGGECAYSKDEIYLHMLKQYGQGGIIKVRHRDRDSILREIRYYEEHEQSSDGDASYYRVWIGSSNYDSAEMSLFLNGVIAECKQLGIETATPAELKRYKEQWANQAMRLKT